MRSQPLCFPLELDRITLFDLLKRTEILYRGHNTMLSAPPPKWGKLSVKTAGKTSGKQYFIINLVHNSHLLCSFHRIDMYVQIVHASMYVEL